MVMGSQYLEFLDMKTWPILYFSLESNFICYFQMKKVAIHVFTVAAGAAGAYCIREYFAGGVCKNKTRLDNKTVIITGCNR